MTTADESRAYMRGRGIAPELMRQASLRAGSGTMAGRVVFPWFDAAGAEVYATGRSLDGAKPKYRHTEGARPALYASPGAWEAPRVALVEGQIDACACAQGGTAAFATSGASAFSAEAADILATKHEVILVADADEAGTKWRGRVVEALGGRGVSLLEARLPDGASDIADVAERAQARGEDPSEVVAEVLAEAVPVEVEAEPETKGGFRLRPLDLTTLLAREPEPERFVVEPYIPRARRVWVFGAAESGKSIWALATAAQVSREGAGVAYFSEENPLDEDIRRLRRLRPDSSHFRFFSGIGLDLDLAEHVAAVIEACQGCALAVFDTISAVWSGDENDNAAIAALDREALMPLVTETGASALVLDHIGHPQAFVKRGGASAGRGASAKGQKADVVLNFEAKNRGEFTIKVGKMRAASVPGEAVVNVLDAADGGLELQMVADMMPLKVQEAAALMVEAIAASGQLTTRQLREAVTGKAGAETQTKAIDLLKAEDPPRVTVAQGVVDTPGSGRQAAKIWRPAGGIMGLE